MKRIYNMCKKLVVAVVALLTTFMSSCTDYLTIIPPDKIVHENFWQTKDDVNGMLATSYLKLLSTDAVTKAIVWGELRADNLKHNTSAGEEIQHIVKANILEDNSYSNWAVYYEAINYANLVIEYAPLVVDRDPDFTEGDLNVVLGEMYAMRALCHFYLVRAFRNIPMALVPAANDADLPEYKQVHPLEALNYIMEDLDRAENMVMPSGNYANPAHNYGRFTKNAVLAIKADVNLWRAAFADYYMDVQDKNYPYTVAAGDVDRYYSLCVDNCRDVLDNMEAQYIKEHPKEATRNNYPYRLLLNEGDKLKDTKISSVYDDIFGTKNSSESILELQVEGSNIDNGYCSAIPNFYGASGNASQVVVPNTFVSNYEVDDLRRYAFMKVPTKTDEAITDVIAVAKYTASTSPAMNAQYRTDKSDANWIVYRKTDVMLMMAEALAANSTSSTEQFKEAFKLVNVINTRARYDTTYSKRYNPLREEKYINAPEELQKIILKERGLELAFEGKRWFDLVRKALREGNTSGIIYVADKLDSNQGTVKSKMSTIDGLFFPINVQELRFNKHLIQNPAYDKEDSSIEMTK